MTPTLDVDDTAFLMKVHRQTVLDLIRGGALPAARIGRAYVLMSSDVLEYIQDAIFEQTADRMRKPEPVKRAPKWTTNAVIRMLPRKVRAKGPTGSNPPTGFEPTATPESLAEDPACVMDEVETLLPSKSNSGSNTSTPPGGQA
ncbi:MAG: helix-turn-helix domain-containing protein [Xylophilus ampelinus]